MIRHLCAGLVVTGCLAGAALATDLSMTPIYKSRPSAASAPDGRLKAEYRPFDFANPGRLGQLSVSALAGVIATPREPMNESRSGDKGRF
jgi:hypothetical protein